MSTSSWQLLCDFLTSVGVDIMDAADADIHISAGATVGAVMVTYFVRNHDGRYFVEGDAVKTEMKTYTFHRPEVVREPRLVQEEVPDV